MKIISVVGARPQFIKLSPLSRELKRKHEELIVHTGQHYDIEMSRVFFEELQIPGPDYNLEVGSGTHANQTGKMLIALEKVLQKEKPNLVIVFGDTNTTLSGALATAKLNIKIAHVEAGPRYFDKSMPEEINRVIADHLSNYLFAPTKNCVLNLRKEGIERGVFFTGDVMLDVLHQHLKLALKRKEMLKQFNIEKGNYLLTTIHRQENTDNHLNLRNIMEALIECKENVVFPVHPRTQKELKKSGIYNKIKSAKNIKLIEPQGYLEFLNLMFNAKKILTDSGGIQKEAYLLKIPCITAYNSTAWIETVQDGWNILTDANKIKIIDAIQNFEPKGKQHDFFGKGNAAKKIVKIINGPES